MFNQWCINEWALSPVPEMAFNRPCHSLALLPTDALNQLVLMVGGALHCVAMRSVVLKHPKQVLNNVFGLEGARFLIQNGRCCYPAGRKAGSVRYQNYWMKGLLKQA